MRLAVPGGYIAGMSPGAQPARVAAVPSALYGFVLPGARM